ncbi:uncharacterized protein PHACADRAFT_246494 [Phanerochaete carnosa HHB-10118-sp]|uniref:HCP-like protein n=1 Tax=Phanerochaete carnosa (strain HHB-10118-sp) TaxID=650164 RepID=K5WM43_PHACS|nr:uncharacterized protein PHACADRAFT_246494 [Phanerochaete carnosa HHB-10118-sp]EKM60505.1 hypothetical protein PHACADRAFT_246494 [Phanerochaete carnosa HHB-10118-sp]
MDQRAPSPLVHVQKVSPLDTLVRRASSRRTRSTQASTRQVAQLSVPETPPKQVAGQQEWMSPHSPLLHTQFRSSVASTAPSAYEQHSYTTDGDGSQLYDVTVHRDRLRDTRGVSMASQHSYNEMDRHPQFSQDSRGVSVASQYSFDEITASYADDKRGSHSGDRVPSVLISTPEPPPSRPGRMPSKLPPGHSNFSLPVPPPRPSEQQKRQVLMRNAHSHSSTSLHEPPRPPPQQPLPPTPAQHLPLPSGARAPSPQGSLYSSYSYYPYEAPLPSPGSQTHLSPLPSPKIAVYSPSSSRNPSPARDAALPEDPLKNPQTAQDYLQLGIQHHLANKLAESAVCFEKSATIGGGCGMGMLMWGLAQRHGWGCAQSESRGFKWLQKAAEVALSDLEAERAAGINKKAVKSEMVLAIYEVGQSFFRGWGVNKDKKMAVSYFRLASELGDPDAQQELAFCLANGKGCKKDRKEAAKWYRAAVAQGASDIGLAWIYKEKFM